MDEIWRYEIGSAVGTKDRKSRVGPWVRYPDHLADKTAALEAQAEEQEEEFKALLQNEQKESDFRHECVINALKSQHAKELAEARGVGEPALIHFEHPNLIGEPCMIHRDYKPRMYRLCGIAAKCDVKLWVTHSMRKLNQKLVGAIVEQAERSNHHAGSAVDLNVVYRGEWFNSEKMRWRNIVGQPSGHNVWKFILAVRNDPGLRWGGTFNTPDPVHFDDNLVLRDPEEWSRRVKELNHD